MFYVMLLHLVQGLVVNVHLTRGPGGQELSVEESMGDYVLVDV